MKGLTIPEAAALDLEVTSLASVLDGIKRPDVAYVLIATTVTEEREGLRLRGRSVTHTAFMPDDVVATFCADVAAALRRL